MQKSCTNTNNNVIAPHIFNHCLLLNCRGLLLEAFKHVSYLCIFYYSVVPCFFNYVINQQSYFKLYLISLNFSLLFSTLYFPHFLSGISFIQLQMKYVVNDDGEMMRQDVDLSYENKYIRIDTATLDGKTPATIVHDTA